MATMTVPQSTVQANRGASVAQSVILAFLYCLPAIWSLRFVWDPDIWWHLAAGDWILQHRAFPHTDPFSAYGAGRPWVAYSWVFEVTAAWLVAHLGLIGLVALQSALSAAIVFALQKLIFRVVPDFMISVALTTIAVIAMDPIFAPRPWLATILFFILVLNVVLQVREEFNHRHLWWLPLIFLVWANIHTQFVYGLFLLLLATAEAWWNWLNDRFSVLNRTARNAWTIAALGCVAATLVNPYFISVYKTAYELGTQPAVSDLIAELQSIAFRAPSDYLLLAIGLAAVAALAWRREDRPFPWVLLLWAMVSSFRMRRDVWMMAVVGTATIAPALRSISLLPAPRSKLQSFYSALGAGLLLAFFCGRPSLSPQRLQAEVAEHYPAAAVKVIEARAIPGPLFNTYNWGGYLIWSLPRLPVSMDGRSLLQGTPRLQRSLDTWHGHRSWESDPELQNANLIIGPQDQPLCALLRRDSRYELIYEDKVASVFVKREQPSTK